MTAPLLVIIFHPNDYMLYSLSGIICREPSLQLLETPSGERELLAFAKAHRADIFIIGTTPPHNDSIGTIAAINSLQPIADIIVISDWSEPNLVLQAGEAGATGFLSTNGSLRDVMTAITALKNNRLFYCNLSKEVMERESKAQHLLNKKPKFKKLTEKEIQVMYYSDFGHSNKEIAVLMDISKRSVDDLKRSIGFKTNTKKTIEMVRYVKENGLM